MSQTALRCPACRLPSPDCLCSRISRCACDLNVTVLRHVLERERNSNTGRLVASALENAAIVDYAVPDAPPWDRGQLSEPDTWLLYPTPGAKQPTHAPKRLIVLDASWSQARRMAQRIPELRSLPRLALPAPECPLPRLRTGTSPDQMSTAESVVAALRALHHYAAADHLEDLLRELVRRFSLPQRRGPQRKKSRC